jgi:hypothetical protein
VQGPTVRLTGTSFDDLANLVRDAADEIARTVEP